MIHVMKGYVPDIKVWSDAVKSEINPTNDFCCIQYACDHMSRARQEKPPLSLVPGKEISGSRSASDIEKWKKRYFETIYVILTAAALSWITSMQRFQSTDWVSFAIVFIQIFSTNACKRFIYNLLFWSAISLLTSLVEFRRQFRVYQCMRRRF